MVRVTMLHKIYGDVTPAASESETKSVTVGYHDICWGSWTDNDAPHVCGFCKPHLDWYFVKSSTVDSLRRWPGMICLTCGWVPIIDPKRERLVNMGKMVHGIKD